MLTHYFFDADTTLVKAFTGTDLLPNRAEKLRQLVADGCKIAIATNQGGAALHSANRRGRYPSVKKVRARFEIILQNVCEATGLEAVQIAIAYGYPDRRTGKPLEAIFKPVELFNESNCLNWRKPNSGMLDFLAGDTPRDQIAYIGDRNSDRGAAEAAGVTYYDAEDFFRRVKSDE